MPKLDNEPCGVEVPVTASRPMIGARDHHGKMRTWFVPADHEVGDDECAFSARDFSVWLTDGAIRDRKLADSRDQGARKLNIMLRKARK